MSPMIQASIAADMATMVTMAKYATKGHQQAIDPQRIDSIAGCHGWPLALPG